MTREEAYNRIDAIIAKHEIDDEYVTITNSMDYDALRMAREFLEYEPCEDCISRKQALEEIDRTVFCYTHQARQIIKDLPSVQPINRKQEEINQALWAENETLEVEIEKYKKAIEDIKAEIKAMMGEVRPFDGMDAVVYTRGFNDGIGSAVDVIDKHIADMRGEE